MFRFNAVVLAVNLLAPLAALADGTLHIPRAQHAPTVAEYSHDKPASAGLEISGFKQYTPGDGDPVSLDTKAYISYDDENLYVVFVCKDDPAQVRARIARREDLFGDEGVRVFIDTFHDQQRAYVFTVNPYGVQMDSKLTEGQGEDLNFDTQWTSDGAITADGFVTTMAIPFKSLRFKNGNVQDWGVAFTRIIPRLNEFSYYPYITKTKEGLAPQFADAEISEPISPGRNIQVIPYGYYGRSRALDPETAEFDNKRSARGGIDAKFVIDDALAVDLTVNPDFSEVESDDPQVIFNKRYEVQFPEKRPFFLENSGFFNTPVPLFFSRRIQDPQYGARLTGREGSWSMGGLLIDDQQAGKFLAPADPDFGKTGKIAVARVQADFDTDSNVGVFVSDRVVGDYSNRVLSFDSRYKLDDNWVATGQFAGSRDELDRNGDYPAQIGHSALLEMTRAGRNFNYDGYYLGVSSAFDTSLGFVPRTDIRQLYQTTSYLWDFPDAEWLVNIGPSLIAINTWDQNNKLQDWSTDSAFVVNGLGQTTFEAHWLDGYELYEGHDFYKNGYSLVGKSEWLSWLTTSLTVGQNDAINYYHSASTEAFLGDARQVNLNFKFTPFAQLRMEQTFLWNDLRTQHALTTVDPVTLASHDYDSGTRVFRDLQSRTKFNYQYSRFWAAHLIIDYDTLSVNPDLIQAPKTRQLSGDLLLSYVLNPGTAIYLGYTTKRENLHLLSNPNRIETVDDLDLRTGRQFFIKFSYLFQY